MKLRSKLFWLVAASISLTACGDDESGGNAGDGGQDGSAAGAPGGGSGGTGGVATGGTGTGGGGAGGGGTGGGGTGGMGGVGGNGGALGVSLCAGRADAAQLECGQYIVEHVSACGECHSERLPTGAIDTALFLAGSAAFADLDPTDPAVGLVPAPNLTQLAAEGWTADDVKAAFQDGVRPVSRGGGLFPIMPYFVFHNMAGPDADAVAAYILSLTPIAHTIPIRQPLPAPMSGLPLPVGPFAATDIPEPTLPTADPNYDEALLGKYLAAEAGICMECHTPRTPMGALDPDKVFAGGEHFEIGPPFGTVTSLNITPATSGIAGWTPDDIRTELLTGVNKDGLPICPPMPVGPSGAFGGLTLDHALAIGLYITSLPPIENPGDGGTFGKCSFPLPPPDGGPPDASVPEAGTPDASASDASPD